MGFLILCVINIVVGIVRSLVVGACIAKVWAWFVTPVFKFMPSLDFKQAVGLSIALGFLLAATQSGVTQESEELAKQSWTYLVMRALKGSITQLAVFPMCLLVAYIWHLYIG